MIGLALCAALFVAVSPPPARGASDGPQRRPPVAVDAVDGILMAFSTRPIVAIDEGTHRNAQVHAFLLRLVSDPRFPSVVDDIVVEFGTARYQAVMDRYISGERVDPAELRLAWRETTQVHVWDHPVYERFFAAVRERNRGLPEGSRLRVLLGDPPIDWTQVTDFAGWARQAPRDSHAAAVVEREVLAKGRRALVIYGGMHLQRRDVSTNYQPIPGERAGLVEHLERARPGATYVVWSAIVEAEVARLGAGAAAWPKPALVPLAGTTLGAVDFARVIAAERGRRTRVVDGKRADVPEAEFATFPFEAQCDALLFVGARESLTFEPYPPDVYADEAYYREVARRSAVLFGSVIEEVERLRPRTAKP